MCVCVYECVCVCMCVCLTRQHSSRVDLRFVLHDSTVGQEVDRAGQEDPTELGKHIVQVCTHTQRGGCWVM